MQYFTRLQKDYDSCSVAKLTTAEIQSVSGGIAGITTALQNTMTAASFLYVSLGVFAIDRALGIFSDHFDCSLAYSMGFLAASISLFQSVNRGFISPTTFKNAAFIVYTYPIIILGYHTASWITDSNNS